MVHAKSQLPGDWADGAFVMQKRVWLNGHRGRMDGRTGSGLVWSTNEYWKANSSAGT